MVCMNWTKAKDQGERDCWKAEVCMGCHPVERDLHVVAGVADTGKVVVVAQH